MPKYDCKDLHGHKNHAECISCKSCVSVESGHKFRDKVSFLEFQISKLCQDCQDKIFGDKNE